MKREGGDAYDGTMADMATRPGNAVSQGLRLGEQRGEGVGMSKQFLVWAIFGLLAIGIPRFIAEDPVRDDDPPRKKSCINWPNVSAVPNCDGGFGYNPANGAAIVIIDPGPDPPK